MFWNSYFFWSLYMYLLFCRLQQAFQDIQNEYEMRLAVERTKTKKLQLKIKNLQEDLILVVCVQCNHPTQNGAPEICIFQHISCMEATFMHFPCIFRGISCTEYTFMHGSYFHAFSIHDTCMEHT